MCFVEMSSNLALQPEDEYRFTYSERSNKMSPISNGPKSKGRAFVVVLVIAVATFGQKAHERYDKFTETTEVSSGQLTVWKCGFLAPPCTMWLESFVLKKGGEVVESGLKITVSNETGWYPNDSVLYVLADEDRRFQFKPSASKTEALPSGRIRTIVTYDIDGEDLRALLGANRIEMKIDATGFKLKDKIRDLKKILPYLESNLAKTATTSPTYGITLEGYNQIKTGMSYTEVVRILGEPGIETARSDVAGYTTVSYQWKVKQGPGNMILMFQNNKLITKAQAMLK
jgi:uncharacterized protein DUF3862